VAQLGGGAEFGQVDTEPFPQACYYALAYLGFAAPFLVDGLGALVGQSGAFAALTAIIATRPDPPPAGRTGTRR
jgi:hypothetical protein